MTVKLRTGVHEKINIAHKILPHLRDCGLSLITVSANMHSIPFGYFLPDIFVSLENVRLMIYMSHQILLQHTMKLFRMFFLINM